LYYAIGSAKTFAGRKEPLSPSASLSTLELSVTELLSLLSGSSLVEDRPERYGVVHGIPSRWSWTVLEFYARTTNEKRREPSAALLRLQLSELGAMHWATMVFERSASLGRGMIGWVEL
jgi:hypothetical protein